MRECLPKGLLRLNARVECDLQCDVVPNVEISLKIAECVGDLQGQRGVMCFKEFPGQQFWDDEGDTRSVGAVFEESAERPDQRKVP